MSLRSSIPFLLSTVLLAIIFIGASPLPLCTDPLGCIWLRPEDPLEIGIARISSGSNQSIAQEVHQGAQIAIDTPAISAGRAIVMRPSYSACIPQVWAQSSIDLAANAQLLAILGPTCPEDAANFWLRMSRSGKTVLSPVPFQHSTNPNWPAFEPDLFLLAAQGAAQVAQFEYTHPLVSASPDEASQAWIGEFCAQLSQKQITCLSDATQDSIPDVRIWLSVAPEPYFLPDASGSWPDLPLVVVSLSVPPVDLIPPVPLQYWIGPSGWNQSTFAHQYQQRFQTWPLSLAAQLSYDSVEVIAEAARQTAVVLWDGTWIIPRQAFAQQVIRTAPHKGLFQFSCNRSSSDCPALPLSLYQWSGNDYRLANP